MYRINQLTLPLDFDKSRLGFYLSKKIGVAENLLSDIKILRLSLDARDKCNIKFIANISFNTSARLNLKKFKIENFEDKKISHHKWQGGDKSIIVVGSGPSGLFSALTLCNAGANVTILERGYEMSKRQKAVDKLMSDGVLDPVSNIQFGEGGAGTFSDGKLNTGTHSPYIKEVLETFHQFGADEDILYNAKAHIGTDILSKVIVNIREYLLNAGCKVLFEHKFIGFTKTNGVLSSIQVDTPNGTISMPCDILILAVGHSARDTVRMLNTEGVEFKQKPFSMGYRIEHLQKDIGFAQYGDNYTKLPPADYSLFEHLNNGRVVYTFCMCPGGVVVPAMSEEGTIVTNGMSYHARDGVNANSALLVTINPSDFPNNSALAGLELQEEYERLSYTQSGGYGAIVQRIGDFVSGMPTTKLGKVTPTFKPTYKLGSVEPLLPKYVVDSIKEALPRLNKKLKGFMDSDAIFTGVETRSSAPYQVIRDNMQTGIDNIYMIGEGAGFAGGIVSSAVEGIKVSDIILSKYAINI